MPSPASSGSCSQPEVSHIEHIPTENAFRFINSLSSQSRLSNDGSLYNAFRASSYSDDEDDIGPRPGNATIDSLDSRMAANVAMFIPLPSEFKASHPAWQGSDISRYSKFGSDYSLPSLKGKRTGEVRTRGLSNLSLPEEEHQARKVASLNDADNPLTPPKWPGNIRSPASPVLPRCPPPTRSPTPPGLPSFDSREAVSYVSQFASPSSIHSRCSQPAGSSRPTPYTELLRRFLGRPSSGARHPESQLPLSAIRAEDGTAVLGRFPRRQSGHNMNVSRRINDHPFHRRNLSVAQCDGAVTDDLPTAGPLGSTIEDRPPPKAPPNTPVPVLNSEQDPSTHPPSAPVTSYSTGSCSRVIASIPILGPRMRADSFYTCSSGRQGTDIPMPAITTEIPDEINSSDDAAGFFLAPTQSPVANTVQERGPGNGGRVDSWLQFFKTISSFYCGCCLRSRSESNNMLDSSPASNDTYVTARAWNSTDNPAENSNPAPESVIQVQSP